MNGRNPFFMRFTEQLGSDAQFLRLFSPGVLNVLPKQDDLWQKIVIIRSSPGGGKTSLLRLFTPTVLQTLYAYRSSDNDNYGELFSRMKDIGVLSEDGPLILGAMLSCAHNYSALEDLELSPGQSQRLLLALLNSRIILSMLRSVTILAQLKYPDDLSKLAVAIPKESYIPADVAKIKSGQELYDWARNTERLVCEFIDRLGESEQDKPVGHDTLFSLYLVTPDVLKFNGVKRPERSLILLDDFHYLANKQREQLLKLLLQLRPPTSVWIAERLDRLSPSEMITQGTKIGRDWHEIYLESFWRDNHKRFVTFAKVVADKRIVDASEGEITSFAGCLESEVREDRFKEYLVDAVAIIKERISKYSKMDERYASFIKENDIGTSANLERVKSLRSLEILIERDKSKKQLTLDFMPPDDSSDVRAAADLFLNKEFNIPYYFGFDRLCILASFNIEQFLAIAGEIFEYIISHNIVSFPSKLTTLTAEEQTKIIARTVDSLVSDAYRRVANPQDVSNFINAIMSYCKEETYRPSAPYSPGVTGIAIEMSERGKLQDQQFIEKSNTYKRLANTISFCLSENLLEPVLGLRCKEKDWMVLYLNRMFCLKSKLPVNYGGWRSIKLHELCQWVDKSYTKRKLI